MPSLPGFAATIACPIPTACAPVGSSRNSEPSLPAGAWAAEEAAASDSSAVLKRSRLIDQHDGDIVAHGIAKPALVAKQRVLRLAVLELALALRTNQNFE
jgi:hypothetical protein